jgi:hypothetical protein
MANGGNTEGVICPPFSKPTYIGTVTEGSIKFVKIHPWRN